MIPRDEEFDVFVSEGVLVEVWRGEHVAVAQQFGVAWDGPPNSVMYQTVYQRPDHTANVPGRATAFLRDPSAPWYVRAWRSAGSLGWAWWMGVAIGSCIVAWGMALGWW